MASDADDRVFESARDDCLAALMAEVRRKAEAEAEAAGEPLRPVHVYRAFDEALHGGGRRRRGFGEWLQDNMFLVLAVLLTLVFGAFGLFHPDDGDVAGFLDIAKIFAGAVVGGAAGGALAGRGGGKGSD
jgi:hypothetical protein